MTEDIARKTKIFVCTTDQTPMSSNLFKDYDIYVSHNASQDDMNYWLNDFTMLLWIGQHIDEIDAEFIGCTNYRRQLDLSKINAMTERTVVVNACKMKRSEFELYALFHNIDDYVKLLLQPQLTIEDKAMIVHQMGAKDMFWRNMFLMHRNMFKEYFVYAQRIRNALLSLKDQIDLESRSQYQHRALAFLAERCTSAWLINKALKKEAQVLVVSAIEDRSIKSPFQRSKEESILVRNENSISSHIEK